MTWAIVILSCTGIITGNLTNFQCKDITFWELRKTPLSESDCTAVLTIRLRELREKNPKIMYQGHCYNMLYKEKS